MDASDDELLDAARAGDKRALEALLLRHQDRVYRFGVQLCRDPNDAKDVLQDTLLSMARSVRGFRGHSSLSTWLYAIARSFCIKTHRRTKAAREHEESLDGSARPAAEALEEPGKDPDASLLGKELSVALERAIRSLEPEQREVLLLRDAEGLSTVETAEVLNLSVAAVKSRLHRARVHVRERIAPLLAIDDDSSLPKRADCPDIALLYSEYLEGDVSPEACARLEAHVADCARCRNTCDALKRTLLLCRTAPPGASVPREVQDAVRRALHDFLSRRE